MGSVARHGPSIAQVPRQHLSHQHVRRLDADANDARQQAHHGIWAFCRRLLQALETGLLERLDLPTDQGEPGHVAAELVQCVVRNWAAFRRAQRRQPLRRLAQMRLEAADAEPGQR
jgi:hypothetical protein